MKGKMRAAVLYEALDLRLEEVDIPTIGPDDVLVRVKSVGICGSDVSYYLDGRCGSFVVTDPLILGHECAGEIVEAGKHVESTNVGCRVAIEPGFACGRCSYCREGRYNLCKNLPFYGTPPYHGAFTEYVCARRDFVYQLPDNVSYEEGAMIEPLAVGMMATKRGDVKVYDKVVILGAGPIGLMTLQAVKAHGALEVYVTDVIDYRLNYAKRLGATEVINPKKEDAVRGVLELTGGEGADVVIEAAGSMQAIRQALKMVRRGGTIVDIGVLPVGEFSVPMTEIVDKELNIHGVFRYANVYPAAIQCVSSGKVDVKSMITHRFPLDKILEGFETHIHRIGNPIKIQIIP